MGKLVDLTGVKKGRLTVLRRAGSNKHNKALWFCVCDCGKELIVIGSHLTNGNTTSCGCYNKEMITLSNRIDDISGEKFGRLDVIGFYEMKNGKSYWLCKCDCGNEIITAGSGLKNNNCKSCGCLGRDKLSKYGKSRFENLENKKFSMLTVIKCAGRDKSNKALWLCLCDCGEETIVSSANLKGATKSCGCLKESYIAHELKKYFKEEYSSISEYKECVNPRTGFFLPFDIYFIYNELKIFIEVQGGQHYKFIKHYHSSIKSYNYQKYKDGIKRRFAKREGLFIEIDLRKIKTAQEAIDYISKKMALSN